MKYIGVFILLVVIDFAWSYYISSIKDGKPYQAAAWSSLMMAMQGLAAIGYTTEPLLLIPAILGAWVGTFLGVKLQNTQIITPIGNTKNATETNKSTNSSTDSFGPG